MKKKLFLALALLCALSQSNKETKAFTNMETNNMAISVSSEASLLSVRAKAAYLMDFNTSTSVYAYHEEQRLPIASMCKIMTLLLCFEAIDAGVLQLDEEILISEKAASMGGSQVFLEANAKYPVSELIKSIVVCSANDSCVAMAEKLAGSQQLFVDRMNEKACALGMHNTLFANCTGLPQETQYSCAKDVAIMLKELLQYEQYYEYGKVWTDHFNHPQGRQTEITNTNKLIRFYDGCDGGKTGFTNEAGFCLAATAKRNGMRVISVIIGAENSVNRFEDTRMLFDYAFATYHTLPIVEEGQPLEQKFTVNGGKSKEISVQSARSAYIFAKKGEKTDYEIEVCVSAIKAPVKKGARLGELLIFKGGIEVDRIPLLAAENVEMASWGDRMQDVAKNWNG